MQRWRAVTHLPRHSFRPFHSQQRCFQEPKSRQHISARERNHLEDDETNNTIKDLLATPKVNVGATLEVNGYVKSIRKQKNVAFAVINDGSSMQSLQAVLKPDDASPITIGSAVKLCGSLVSSKGSGQNRELQVETAQVLGNNDPENNPLQPKYQTPEFLRTIPHLRPRIPANALLLRARSELIKQVTSWFGQHGWTQCHTPIITSSDCEGAGEVFTIEASGGRPKSSDHPEHFFRQPKYLTVSAQLHLEALSQAVNKVWTLSPTFRAEKSDTARHLSEFYMLEAELCFVQDMNQVMDVVRDLIRACALAFDVQIADELLGLHPEQGSVVTRSTLSDRWDGVRASDWPRITYAEAVKLLEDAASGAGFEIAPSYDAGLQAEHERWLAKTVGQNTPIFVTDYPKAQKPFYMAPSTSTANSKGTDDTVACFDLLVPDLGELVGGSMRKHDLIENLPGHNLDWYQDLRRFGSVPHGGFGLGFDRLLCYLTGISNIRDVVAFPRWYGRCDC